MSGWIRNHLTQGELWGDPDGARDSIETLLAELAVAARSLPFPVVLVSQELSWGPLPADFHDRLLGDLNAHVNEVLGAASHRVHAVIAGRVLDLSQAPVAGAS